MVSIDGKKVGDGEPCFIVFEAGPTHDGVDSAKRLIDAAAEAGGDAVKFQIIDPDRLVADRTVPFSYDVLLDKETGATETVSEPLYDILCRRSLSFDEWREVKAHADARGIAFFATIGFIEEIELVKALGCDSIKIASADVNHFPLLLEAGKTGMCIQLDTGNSSLGEIEAAVDVINSTGNNNIIIHQCPSGYPARLTSINLNIIKTLKQMFPELSVAFSDHTPDYDMDIAAVALGANLVEKTITEDRCTRSVEHIMSLEPQQMAGFVQSIRAVETALGSHRRIMSPEELEKRKAVRRSVHVNKDLAEGHVLSLSDFDYRRPGYGIPPNRVDELVGKVLGKKKQNGDLLAFQDLVQQ